MIFHTNNTKGKMSGGEIEVHYLRWLSSHGALEHQSQINEYLAHLASHNTEAFEMMTSGVHDILHGALAECEGRCHIDLKHTFVNGGSRWNYYLCYRRVPHPELLGQTLRDMCKTLGYQLVEEVLPRQGKTGRLWKGHLLKKETVVRYRIFFVPMEKPKK